MNKIPKRPRPNVIRVSDGKQWDEPAAQQSVQWTAGTGRRFWQNLVTKIIASVKLALASRR